MLPRSLGLIRSLPLKSGLGSHFTKFIRTAASWSASTEGNYLKIKQDGKEKLYPAVWLRDNCQYEECFSKGIVSRIFLMKNLDTDVQVSEVKVTAH